MLFVLHTSKTHGKDSKPQLIKIKSTALSKIKPTKVMALPCPFSLLGEYLSYRGSYKSDKEPFFVFLDKRPVCPTHFRSVLKQCLKMSGFDERNYNTHSLRLGRSCDLYKLGLTAETIKKLGRWKSNVVFRYLKDQ